MRVLGGAAGGLPGLVTDLHYLAAMRGVVAARGFHPGHHHGAVGAGWRRAYRLAGRLDAAAVRESQKEGALPLDRGEKSGIVKTVDANVPPDQPPSTPDSPASVDLRLGLSVTGIASASEAFTPSSFPSPAQFPAAIPVAVSPPPA